MIQDLRDEIEVLKAELLELRSAMKEIKSNAKQQGPNQVSDKLQSPCSETDGWWTKVVKDAGRRNANAANGRQARRTNRKSNSQQRS